MALGEGVVSPSGLKRGFSFLLASLAVAAGLVAGALSELREPIYPALFPPFTSVQGVEISGLTEEEAKKVLRAKLDPLLDLKVALVVEGKRYFTTWRRLGASLDIEGALREARRRARLERLSFPLLAIRSVPVRARFDEGNLLHSLHLLARRANRRAVNARLLWLGEGRREIVPEREGLELKVGEGAQKVREVGRFPRAAAIALPVSKIKPKVTSCHLEPVRAVIGAFSTRFNPGSRNRAHNIRLVAKHLRGVVVMPGEVFSFNKAVGSRTRARGFLPAPIFVRRKVVIGIGGGACQVSSTLYNAARRAGMKIVERHFHSLPVDYVPPGYDATVVYGALDMKFKNPLPHPVVIWTTVRGGGITILLLGALERSEKVTE